MINFLTSFHWLVVVFLVFTSFAISFFYYRNLTTVSRFIWGLLLFLRTAGCFLIFLLFSQPIIKISQQYFSKPNVIFLVDNSQSISFSLKQMGKTKEEFSKNLSSAIDKLGSGFNYSTYFFSNQTSLGSFDSLFFNGSSTNISQAIKFANTLNNSASQIVLVSDGNHNSQQAPFYAAENSAAQIFTIGLGTTKQNRDVVLQNLNTNSIAFNNVSVPVEFSIGSSGFEGKNVLVSLLENNNPLEVKNLKLPNNSFEVLRSGFQYTPKAEGINKISVKVNPVNGEYTLKNNILSTFISVKKTKLKITLLSGSPNPDASFINRVVSSDENIELVEFLQKPSGDVFSLENKNFSSSLNEADCIVLVGFPNSNSSMETIIQIKELVENKNTPLLFLLSRTSSLNLISELGSALPFKIISKSTDEVIAQPQTSAEHFLLGGIASLKNATPFFTLQNVFQPNSEATVLLRDENKNPLLIVQSVAGRKSLAFTSYGLWRWQLNDEGNTSEEFLLSTIRWLGSKDKEKIFRVILERSFFGQNETVNFNIEAYTETYQPKTGLQINFSIKNINTGQAKNYNLSGTNNGIYSTSINGLLPGDYYFTASTTGGEKFFDDGKFSIGEESPEFLQTTLNETLLRNISTLSGGSYFDYKNFESLVDTLIERNSINKNIITKTSEVELRSSFWYLFLILTFFSIEWALRKFYSML